MKTRDEILRENRLTSHLSTLGLKGRGAGKERSITRCALRQHKPDHFCCTVNTDLQIWHCHDCKVGGSLIDWLMHERGQSAAEVLASFNDATAEPVKEITPANPRITAIYDYTNESGELLYQAVRMEPKSFRQRRSDGKGGWHWNMDGVTRVLYNLPAVLSSPLVFICEGEKDCQTLASLGYVATCNVGGAGKWLPAYAERLKGKDIIICPDGDSPGRKHGEDVLASLEGICGSSKVVPMPEPYKDVSDYVASFPDLNQAKREFDLMVSKCAHAVKPLPIYSIAEIEAIYLEHAKTVNEHSFDLSKWLPEFKQYLPPMVPGECLLLLADTGVGKTAIMQCLLRAAAPLPSLMFELELPLTLLFERLVQQEIGCYRADIQTEYKTVDKPLWSQYRGLHHVMVCPESGLTVSQIESYIVRSELKFGRRPVVVCVDYVGLVSSDGRSRYESVSSIAEEFKKLAKRTNTILLVASQIARPKEKKEITVGLHDAKDSGSLECSAGIVIGAWRPEKNRLMLKILKATSGESGAVIEAHMDGAKMRITQAK